MGLPACHFISLNLIWSKMEVGLLDCGEMNLRARFIVSAVHSFIQQESPDTSSVCQVLCYALRIQRVINCGSL